MADVNFNKQSHPGAGAGSSAVGDRARGDTPRSSSDVPYDLIELLFFAYRDFTSDPDDVLAEFGFGRAHHRVLHFVDRNPGMMVTDLLGILKITKQSLGRVLKQLVDQGYIEQRPGASDRRQRLLHTTAKGHGLALQLARLQTERLDRAILGLPDDAADTVRRFLLQMIDPETRDEVAQLIRKDTAAGGPASIKALDQT
ncbi:MAG: winged helix-turn-helix transcriptional regulator [Roseibium sp.]|nr:winged helix-turn-helix transcriptional regulator [Roseibium sp.]